MYSKYNRNDLESKKQSLEEMKKQMGINKEYRENNHQNELIDLVNSFRASDDLAVKEEIAEKIVALRGELPLDIQMELNSLKAPKR